MADIVTLNEVRTLLGYDPSNTTDDAKITGLIPAATIAIVNYAERDFSAPQTIEARTFEYDGSGWLDINDCTLVTSVEMVIPNAANIVLPSDTWTAKPHGGPIYNYISLLAPYSGINVAMGFKQNYDVLYAEGRLCTGTNIMQVTAQWGWPSVPTDVKLATAWTIQDWMTKPSSDGLSSEAIEGWSRSWRGSGGASNPFLATAIPKKAQDLLAQYAVEKV